MGWVGVGGVVVWVFVVFFSKCLFSLRLQHHFGSTGSMLVTHRQCTGTRADGSSSRTRPLPGLTHTDTENTHISST